MPSVYALAAPFALIVPFFGQSSTVPVAMNSAGLERAAASEAGADGPSCAPEDRREARPVRSAINPLNALQQGQVNQQIRIERRVIVRISPRRRPDDGSPLAVLPQQPLNSRYEERKMDNCIPVSSIAGVQTGSGSRLLLFLRDRRIINVNLEKSCRARDFYSGFYVERNKDGKLCVKRDELQSRTGAKCEVARMRQLVAVKN